MSPIFGIFDADEDGWGYAWETDDVDDGLFGAETMKASALKFFDFKVGRV